MMIQSSTSRRLPRTRQRSPLILHEQVDGKGRGVFAGKAFSRQEEVLEFLGDIRDVSELPDLTHALQIGPRQFLSASGDVDDYVNHSCQPNCGIRSVGDRVILFALKSIREDEEITFDYSTTQFGGFWVMECSCGAPNCRGNIGDFDALPSRIRNFYITNDAVLSYLLTEVEVSR